MSLLLLFNMPTTLPDPPPPPVSVPFARGDADLDALVGGRLSISMPGGLTAIGGSRGGRGGME